MTENDFAKGGRASPVDKGQDSESVKSETDYVTAPHPGPADYLIGGIAYDGSGFGWGRFEIPFVAGHDDAADPSEIESFDFPDEVGTVSLEDIFGIGLDDGIEYHGSPTGVSSSELTEEQKNLYDVGQLYKYGDKSKGEKSTVSPPEWVEHVSDSEEETRGATYYCARLFNAWYLPEIWEEFGAGTRISFGKSKVDGSPQEQYSWVELSVQDSESSILKILKGLSSDKGEAKVLGATYEELLSEFGVTHETDDGSTENVEVEDWDEIEEKLTEEIREIREQEQPWERDSEEDNEEDNDEETVEVEAEE